MLAGPPWRGRDLVASASGLTIDRGPVPVVALGDWADLASCAGPLPEVSPDALLMIQYTSGTTGTPKGAMLSHLVGTNVGPLSHLSLGLTERDIVCSPLPFHHVGGSVCTVLATLLRGATFVVLPGFEPAQALAMLVATEASFFGCVPTMLLAMLEEGGDRAPDLPALRLIMVGGTTVSPALITRIEREFGVEVTQRLRPVRGALRAADPPRRLCRGEGHDGGTDEQRSRTCGARRRCPARPRPMAWSASCASAGR